MKATENPLPRPLSVAATRARTGATAGLALRLLGDRLRCLLALPCSPPGPPVSVSLALLAARGLDRQAVADLLCGSPDAGTAGRGL